MKDSLIVSLQFENFRLNFPKNKINCADLLITFEKSAKST